MWQQVSRRRGFAVAAAALPHVRIALAIDACPEAAKTYERAHGMRVLQIDITDVAAVLAAIAALPTRPFGCFASPPCQSFSLAGHRDPNDPRASVLAAIIDIVLAAKFQLFVLENVPQMLWAPQFMDAEQRLARADRRQHPHS